MSTQPMSLTFRNVTVKREDDNNIKVSCTQLVEERINGGRGKGPGEKTGNLIEKETRNLFYSSLSHALFKAAELVAEDSISQGPNPFAEVSSALEQFKADIEKFLNTQAA